MPGRVDVTRPGFNGGNGRDRFRTGYDTGNGLRRR